MSAIAQENENQKVVESVHFFAIWQVRGPKTILDFIKVNGLAGSSSRYNRGAWAKNTRNESN